jgi:hypothetical protein
MYGGKESVQAEPYWRTKKYQRTNRTSGQSVKADKTAGGENVAYIMGGISDGLEGK